MSEKISGQKEILTVFIRRILIKGKRGNDRKVQRGS